MEKEAQLKVSLKYDEFSIILYMKNFFMVEKKFYGP